MDWTTSKVKRLKELAGKEKAENIAREFGTTVKAIRLKAYKLKISLRVPVIHEYCLYKGDEMIFMGTIPEIAKHWGVSEDQYGIMLHLTTKNVLSVRITGLSWRKSSRGMGMDQFMAKLKKKNAEIAKLKQTIGRLERELKAEQEKNKWLSSSNKQMAAELERLRIVQAGFLDQVKLIDDLQKRLKESECENGCLRAMFD